MTKRVLIIGYLFVDSTMGGIRLRRLSRLLPRQGWESVVLTHPSAAGSVSLPAEVRREEVAAPDLARLYASLRRLRRRSSASPPTRGNEPTALATGLTTKLNRWLMVPDKQMTWYRAAVKRGRELLQRERFDLIFASLDPRTSLLVAARLSRDSGVPCLLEYRDLWTGTPYHAIGQPTALHRRLHERLERRALRQASRVSAVCRGIADYLARKHVAILRSPVEVNYNFFDPAEYPAPEVDAKAARPFIVSYTGAMYVGRSPSQFFAGLRAFIDQTRLTPAEFRFRWAGSISGLTDVGQAIDAAGVRPYLDFLGQVPHREALRELVQSDAALLIQAPHDTIHIPGKLFEAMGARVPLLALANPCEVTEIINRSRAGIVCPHATEAIARTLGQFYQLFTRRERWEFEEPEIQRFSANAAVARLATLFDQAAGKA